MPADWVSRTEAVMRTIAEEVRLADATDCLTILRQWIDRVEPAPDCSHSITLRLMLVNLCGQIVAAAHREDRSWSCSCRDVAWDLLPILTNVDDLDPRVAFWKWVESFFVHAGAEHPSTPAQRGAALIRSDSARAWTLQDLGDMVGSHPRRLSAEFRKLFGLTPAGYVHLVRIARAVVLSRTSAKVEGVASEVGYRSKKDFYAALKRWVGLTPTELRQLRDEESIWLERELRRRCLSAAGQRLRNAGATNIGAITVGATNADESG